MTLRRGAAAERYRSCLICVLRRTRTVKCSSPIVCGEEQTMMMVSPES